MVIFHHAAVYIDNKRLFKSIQKQRKLQRSGQSTHSTFTQPVHFTQTNLRQPEKNFAILFCSQITLNCSSIGFVFCFRQLSKFVKNR